MYQKEYVLILRGSRKLGGRKLSSIYAAPVYWKKEVYRLVNRLWVCGNRSVSVFSFHFHWQRVDDIEILNTNNEAGFDKSSAIQ
ncbi:hypothetical protein ACTXT7_003524 [Hymenolepis weldensis]